VQSGESPPCCLPPLLAPPPPAAEVVVEGVDLGFVHLGFRGRKGGRTWWMLVAAETAVVALTAVLESPETMAGGEFFCGKWFYS